MSFFFSISDDKEMQNDKDINECTCPKNAETDKNTTGRL